MKNKKKKNQPEPDTKRKKLKIYLGLLILIPLVLYVRVVDFQFTKFDDTDIIIRHYDKIKDLKNINQAFNHDFYMDTTGTVYYRPIPVVSFMIDAQFGGEEPVIYYLTNLILHIITVIVLFFSAEAAYKTGNCISSFFIFLATSIVHECCSMGSGTCGIALWFIQFTLFYYIYKLF